MGTYDELVDNVRELFSCSCPINISGEGDEAVVSLCLKTRHQHYIEIELTELQVITMAIKARDMLRLADQRLSGIINRSIPLPSARKEREGDTDGEGEAG